MWYPSGQIKKRWDGLLTCEKDWETRHPQTLLKIRAETAVPAFVSKDADPDPYVLYCDLWSRSPMADYGEADCFTVGGNTNIPLLIDIFNTDFTSGRYVSETPGPVVDQTSSGYAMDYADGYYDT
jgi:hypothetical protein